MSLKGGQPQSGPVLSLKGVKLKHGRRGTARHERRQRHGRHGTELRERGNRARKQGQRRGTERGRGDRARRERGRERGQRQNGTPPTARRPARAHAPPEAAGPRRATAPTRWTGESSRRRCPVKRGPGTTAALGGRGKGEHIRRVLPVQGPDRGDGDSDGRGEPRGNPRQRESTLLSGQRRPSSGRHTQRGWRGEAALLLRTARRSQRRMETGEWEGW